MGSRPIRALTQPAAENLTEERTVSEFAAVGRGCYAFAARSHVAISSVSTWSDRLCAESHS